MSMQMRWIMSELIKGLREPIDFETFDVDDYNGEREVAADEIERITAENESLKNTRAVPEGMALVPVEPTEAMVFSAFCDDDDMHSGELYRKVYKAMLQAAEGGDDG